MTKLTGKETEILRDLDRGRYDIAFFQEKILGIPVNPAQRRWYNLINPAEDGFSWRLRYVLHVAANQVGKTLGMAVIILWACMYKIGYDRSNPRAWFSAEYVWFHVAPSQNQAYLTLTDIRQIIKGAHLSQERGRKDFNLEFRLPEGMVWETKIEGYYDGLEFYNGAICQFRTTEEKAKALLGRRAAGISFDEAAFENHLITVVDEVLWMRLIASGGPLLIVSTPNGMNDFYELVTQVRDRGAHVGLDAKVWVNTDLHEGLTQSTIEDNIGFGVSQAEATRMYASIGEDTRDQQLRGAFLSSSDVFFRPQEQILSAFRDNLPLKQGPKPGHRYMVFIDPSMSSDPTAIVVIDVTTRPWVGVYYDWQKVPIGLDRLAMQISGLHALYNSATDRLGRFPRSTAVTGFDATSMGGAIVRQALRGITPQRPINFGGTGKIKRDALVNLRGALTTDQLLLPAGWTRMKREILNYDLDDKDLQQDSVMALAGAVAMTSGGGTGRSQRADMHARVTTRSSIAV